MNEFQLRTQVTKPNGFDWMGADAYLFDIDGTLLVSRDGVHRNALHRAMREAYAVDTTIEGIAYHGKTDLGILRAALERAGVSSDRFEANLPAALEVVCRDVSANAGCIKPTVCSAIPEVLAELKSAGKLLGLASGNLEAVGWLKIEAAGLRDFFSFGCFSDRNESRADIFRQAVQETQCRLGESARVCFIGDTPEDIKAARLANSKIVAVCTGIFGAEELARHEPDVCVASCADLLVRMARK
ncbi:MAG TPA: HAD family hydrolase [Terriglobales bacterium]|nr:HAD family hydrolase [Terriglobales bacterium]